jgi:chromosomal replication initiator protein
LRSEAKPPAPAGEMTRGSTLAARRPQNPAPRDAHRNAHRSERNTTEERPRRAIQQGFDNFVVGLSNTLAREASLSLARSRSSEFTQLYLAADSGLGKTHLARAVASESARLGSSRIRYCTAESFTNEFMTAVRTKEMGRFKRRYRRECEVLIVEDVGFFDSKALTQLEFFHSVQHVLDAGGRVVLTGDRLPHELRGLDEKVRKQLSGGFVAELVAPDEQLRREIIRAKAAAGGVRLPESCVEMIVDEADGSVRDLADGSTHRPEPDP